MGVRPRPRFERHTTLAVEVLQERLRSAIRRSDGALAGEVLDNHAQVMIAGPRRHAWSPCLTLSYQPVEEDTQPRLRIRGLFGPSPSLWTLVATGYAIAAFLMFVGILVGWSQSLLDRTPSGFLGVLAGAVIAILLYIASLSGQALAHDEMNELADLLDRAIDAGDRAEPPGRSVEATERCRPE